MWFLSGFFSFLGRIMFCAIFVLSAAGKLIPEFGAVAADMDQQGIPESRLMLIGAILCLLTGSLLVIIGYRARLGATLLLVFLVLVTYFYHDFWTLEPQSPEYATERIHFMKNVALAGMAVFMIGNGAGAWSIGPFPEDDEELVEPIDSSGQEFARLYTRDAGRTRGPSLAQLQSWRVGLVLLAQLQEKPTVLAARAHWQLTYGLFLVQREIVSRALFP